MKNVEINENFGKKADTLVEIKTASKVEIIDCRFNNNINKFKYLYFLKKYYNKLIYKLNIIKRYYFQLFFSTLIIIK